MTTTQEVTGRTNRGNAEFTVPVGTEVQIETRRKGFVVARIKRAMEACGEYGNHWAEGPEEAFAA